MSREKETSRAGWEGFVLDPCVPVCGCPWERVPIWSQNEDSAFLMDLATSGAARETKKHHVCSRCEMNHASVQYSLVNDSSESSESNISVCARADTM